MNELAEWNSDPTINSAKLVYQYGPEPKKGNCPVHHNLWRARDADEAALCQGLREALTSPALVCRQHSACRGAGGCEDSCPGRRAAEGGYSPWPWRPHHGN